MKERGVSAAEDAHAELLHQGGLFASLAQLQFLDSAAQRFGRAA